MAQTIYGGPGDNWISCTTTTDWKDGAMVVRKDFVMKSGDSSPTPLAAFEEANAQPRVAPAAPQALARSRGRVRGR